MTTNTATSVPSGPLVYIASIGYSDNEACIRLAALASDVCAQAALSAYNEEAAREFDSNAESWESLDDVLADLWIAGPFPFSVDELTPDELGTVMTGAVAHLEPC